VDVTEGVVGISTDALVGECACSCTWTTRVFSACATICAFPTIIAFANGFRLVAKSKDAFTMSCNTWSGAVRLITQMSSEAGFANASIWYLFVGIVWIHTTAPKRNIASS